MIQAPLRSPPHSRVACLCLGLGAANLYRPGAVLAAAVICLIAAAAASAPAARVPVVGCVLVVGGWWIGGNRLAHLDRSPLLTEVGRAERALVVVTAPPRRGRFDVKVPVRVRRFGRLNVDERAELELPLGRSPPLGAIVDVRAEVKLPRGPRHGFDERTWLRRHGIHVVLAGDDWRIVGRRRGIGGVGDALRTRIARSVASGVGGERRGVLLGVVLGDEAGLTRTLRDRFRASGLYHLLAVSGQNVVLVGGGTLLLAWLLGIPRWLGELGALASIGGYVLAVGLQPSVVRAGVAGALGSLAWLAARPTDRWYFLLLGALALLAWNPYSILDAGFQLSFTAVIAIFVVAPRVHALLEGYPLPPGLRGVLAVSTACGLATAPVLWFQFHAIPLVAVPANAAAAPAVVPLLGLALAAAFVQPLAPSLAFELSRLDGLCAAYLAGCARLFGSLPFAQVRSGWVAAAGVAVGAGAYAWRRWPT